MKSLKEIIHGIEYWQLPDGRFHREDGPAVVQRKAGYRAYYIEGKRHRLDGPACVYDDGREAWVVNDVDITGIQKYLSSTKKILEYFARTELRQSQVEAALVLALYYKLLTEEQAKTISASYILK